MTMDYEFTSEFDSISDIAQSVVEEVADAQDVSTDEVDIVPVTAIDEAAMPRALVDPDSLPQAEWDNLRRAITAEVEALGPRVN